MTAIRLFVARVRFTLRHYRMRHYFMPCSRWALWRRYWRDACELSFVDDDGSIGFFPF